MATTTAVTAPAESTAQTETLQERIDAAEQALGKADAAVERLRAESRSVPPRVRAVLAEAADGREAGRASAEERLLALCKRRSELPALIAIAEAIAAGAEIALREPSPRRRMQRATAASRREATGYARQAAADHFEKAQQRLAAALSATLE